MLKRTGGNKSQAARILKIDYKTMHYKVKNYGIKIQTTTEITESHRLRTRETKYQMKITTHPFHSRICRKRGSINLIKQGET